MNQYTLNEIDTRIKELEVSVEDVLNTNHSFGNDIHFDLYISYETDSSFTVSVYYKQSNNELDTGYYYKTSDNKEKSNIMNIQLIEYIRNVLQKEIII